jgi:hypothetical protein
MHNLERTTTTPWEGGGCVMGSASSVSPRSPQLLLPLLSALLYSRCSLSVGPPQLNSTPLLVVAGLATETHESRLTLPAAAR